MEIAKIKVNSVHVNSKFTEPFVFVVEFLRFLDLEPRQLLVRVDFQAKNRTTLFKQRIVNVSLKEKIKAGKTKIRITAACVNFFNLPSQLLKDTVELKLQFYYRLERFLLYIIPLRIKYNQEDMRVMPPPTLSFENFLMSSNEGDNSKKYFDINWD